MMMDMDALSEAIAGLAQGQHGAFTRRQARAEGLTHDAVLHGIRAGVFERVVGDVLRFPWAPCTWRQKMMIATLAGGPHAAASHSSAAALHGFPGFKEGPIETVRLRGSDHD